MDHCINCGVKLAKSDDFCVKCGAKIEQAPIADAKVFEKEADANKLIQSFNPEVKSTTPYKFIIFGVVLTMLFGVFTFLIINSKIGEIQVLKNNLDSEKRRNNTYILNIKELDNRVSYLKNDLSSFQLKLKTAERAVKVKRKLEATKAIKEMERIERDANTKRKAIITSGEKEKKERLAKEEKKQLDELNRKYYSRAKNNSFLYEGTNKYNWAPHAAFGHFYTTPDDYVEFMYHSNNDKVIYKPLGTYVLVKIRGKIGFLKTRNLIKRN